MKEEKKGNDLFEQESSLFLTVTSIVFPESSHFPLSSGFSSKTHKEEY